ncbi:Por secretion system C-terminal sorting domain-containing protein [Flavobacterium caeni]|uniref:Por secretion system C-terminal sorting domain-containing protein n=1 Tax=Flavobacterium caeni TaxID=490189 RepID=A0A1G5HTG1_9FLAO|nr:Por secretion system C-terminal sorting domain-containing protein [Flavobacterium caeni]
MKYSQRIFHNKCGEKCNFKTHQYFQCIRPVLDENGICHYEFKLNFENTSGADLYITITNNAGLGVLSPSTILIPATAVPGSPIQFTFVLYPIGPFAGGTLGITFNGETADHKNLCTQKIQMEFPALECEKDPNKVYGQSPSAMQTNDTKGILNVVPNPASQSTEIRYVYKTENNAANREIEVYDLVGRPVFQIKVRDANGNVPLDINGFPAGYYVVLLKENGETLQQQKLIVK